MNLLMNIGCIECGVTSKVVGIFSDKLKADELADALNKTHHWREGGQNSFEVFEIPALDVVDAEYLKDAA